MANPWEELAKQLTNPWDWVAAGLGALGGGVVTVLSHGTDLGQSIGAGALTGVTARKAAAASMQGRGLGKRADGLRSLIEEELARAPNPTSHLYTLLDTLLAELNREQRLWRAKTTSNEQFSKKLDELVDKYRRIFP